MSSTTVDDTESSRPLEQVKEALSRSARTVRETVGEKGGETLGLVRDKGKEALASVGEAVRTKGGRAVETVRERGGSAAGNLAATAKVLGRRSGQGLREAADRLRPAARTLGKTAERATVGLFHALGLPHLEDLHDLNRRIEELTAQVDRLVAHGPQAVAADLGAEETAAGPPVYHVVKVDDGWAIEAEGASEPASVHGNKKGALEAARTLAHSNLPSRLVIHRMDGSVQDDLTYEAD